MNFRFECVNRKYFWLIVWQKVDDWDLLSNNRTILLFENGDRFIAEDQALKSSETFIDAFDQVRCYEEFHVDISDAVQAVCDHYESHKFGSQTGIKMRIGRHETTLPFSAVRTLAAMKEMALNT